MSKIDEVKELQKLVQEKSKEVLGEVFKEFFAQNPEIQSLKWEQYTPHFNDGEPCVFRIYSLRVCKDLESEEGDYEDGYLTTYDLDDTKDLVLIANITQLEETLELIEDTLAAEYGDGSVITISKDGTVEVDEYDHD